MKVAEVLNKPEKKRLRLELPGNSNFETFNYLCKKFRQFSFEALHYKSNFLPDSEKNRLKQEVSEILTEIRNIREEILQKNLITAEITKKIKSEVEKIKNLSIMLDRKIDQVA